MILVLLATNPGHPEILLHERLIAPINPVTRRVDPRDAINWCIYQVGKQVLNGRPGFVGCGFVEEENA